MSKKDLTYFLCALRTKRTYKMFVEQKIHYIINIKTAKQMKKITFITFLLSSIFIACTQDEWTETADAETAEAIFKLYNTACEETISRSTSLEEARYDRLEYYIADEQGNCIDNIKSKYNHTTAEIHVEGLHEGNYLLLVLGIKGDESKDHAEIQKLNRMDDTWLTFPENLHKPLEAEYFYSQTPFTISSNPTESGLQEVATIHRSVEQKRIISKINFDFQYNNPYVRNAVTGKTVSLKQARFYTTLLGNGNPAGESDNIIEDIDISQNTSYCFMPLLANTTLEGEITMRTRNYLNYEMQQTYAFRLNEMKANHIHQIETNVSHPDDQSAVMFLTGTAYDEGRYEKILQDNEPKEIYSDPSLRQFNTAQPLQLEFTTEGKLHVRFYSPRKLDDVLIKAYIPAVCNEYFDIAYFDTIPGFADFYETTPLIQRNTMCHTESGRQIEVQQLDIAALANAQFKIESSDPYWSKLEKIKHGWNIYWGLYGGNPDLENGGPTGNWMGIRPVHCRESVALFLNFTYMIDMPEHEQILRENADKLYDDNKNPIQVEQVLQQMRQKRTLQVGLVYAGNGVLGLGGGSTFGAYQQAWFEHYWNAYSCNIMFHELGHVMGYGHSSSFTYGPWAEELMNNFYVQNISQFPIDSPSYLNSKNNPNKYN